MKKRLTIQLAVVAAITASSANPVGQAWSPAQAGTWEDDCNLSKSALVSRAALPGPSKTASLTRTAIGFHDRACRQVAQLDAVPRPAA